MAARHPGSTIFVSAVLAGWLMGLLSWLVTAARDTISQIVIVFMITGAIGLAHLHHSIVGAKEVLSGMFAGQGITWGTSAVSCFSRPWATRSAESSSSRS